MEVSFVKLSPTQNVTILVTDAVPRKLQPEIAARLLACDGVGGEQVGFLEAPAAAGALARLQMMGGEFCGNATMALGAYLAWTDGLADGEALDGELEVSGAERPVSCRILREGTQWRGTVQMPLPERMEQVELETDGGAVRADAIAFSGITHVVLPVALGIGRPEIERRIREWNARIGADALGVLRFDAAAGRIEPIVYVPATDSAVWERGCGSGTAAAGCWMARRAGSPFSGEIRQPGGAIEVSAGWTGTSVDRLSITGRVKIVARGVAYL